jgi:hypothetical protein
VVAAERSAATGESAFSALSTNDEASLDDAQKRQNGSSILFIGLGKSGLGSLSRLEISSSHGEQPDR